MLRVCCFCKPLQVISVMWSRRVPTAGYYAKLVVEGMLLLWRQLIKGNYQHPQASTVYGMHLFQLALTLNHCFLIW